MPSFPIQVILQFSGQGEAAAKAAFERMGSAAGRLNSALGAIKWLAVGHAALSLGHFILDTTRRFELLRARLETVEGSTEAGTRAFARLQSIAAHLPVTLEETTNAWVKLRSQGIEPSEDRLLSYGNTAAAMGKSLDAFTEAVLDAQTGEFERLKEFGIKAKTEGDKVRFSFQGSSTVVKKTSKEIVGYLDDIGKKQFAGAAARQMETMEGTLSNLKDTAAKLADAVGSSGLSRELVILGQSASTSASGGLTAAGIVGKVLAALVGVVRPLLSIIQGFFEGFAAGLARIAQGVVAVGAQILDAFAAMNRAVGLPVAAKSLSDVAKLLHNLQSDLGDTGKTLTDKMIASWGRAGTQLGEMVNRLTGVDQAVATVAEKTKKTGDDVGAELEKLKQKWESIWEKGDPVGAAVKHLRDGLKVVKDALAAHIATVAQAVKAEAGLRKAFAKELIDFVGELKEIKITPKVAVELPHLLPVPPNWQLEGPVQVYSVADLEDSVALIRQGTTEEQRQVALLQRAQELRDKGLLTAEQYYAIYNKNRDKVVAGVDENAAAYAEIWNNTIQGVQNAFAGFFFSILRDGKISFESLWKSFADLGARAISEVLAKWATAKFVANFQGKGGGTSATAGTSLLSGSGASSSAWLAAAGALAVVAAAVYFKMREDKKFGQRFDSSASLGYGTSEAYARSGGKLTETSRLILEGMLKIRDALESGAGVMIRTLASVEIQVQNNKKEFRAFLNGALLGTYRTANEAIIAAMQSALLSADYASKLAPALQQVIAGALRFATPEAFSGAISSVSAIVDAASGLSDLELEMQRFPLTLAQLQRTLVSAGVSIAEAERLVGGVGLQSLDAWRRQIEGREQTAEEELAVRKRQAVLYEAQRQLWILQLEAEERNLEAQGELGNVEITLGRTRIQAEGEGLAIRARLYQDEIAITAGYLTALGAVTATGETDVQARLAAIRQILAQLRAAGINIDALKPGRGSGGRGNQAAQDAQRLDDLLRQASRSGLNELDRALAELNDRWSDARELAHGNADALARINAARQREREQILQDQLNRYQGSSTPVEQLNEILAHFGRLLTEFGSNADDAAEIASHLNDALRNLADQSIDGLGLPLESLRDRLASMADVLAMLGTQAVAGTIGADRYAQVLGELSAEFGSEMASLAQTLLEQMGASDRAAAMQARIREAEFRAQVLQLQMLYQAATAAGLIDDAARGFWSETIDYISDPANWPDFAHLPDTYTPPDGGVDTGGGAPDQAAEQLQRARDILASWRDLGLSAYQREMRELAANYDLVRSKLGNTTEVQAAYARALDDLRNRYLQSVRQVRDALRFGGDSGLTASERRRRLQAEFERVRAAVEGGDLGQADRLAQLASDLNQATREALGANSTESGRVSAYLDAVLSRLLGESIPGSANDNTANAVERLQTASVSELQGLRRDVQGLATALIGANQRSTSQNSANRSASRAYATAAGSWSGPLRRGAA